MWTPVPLLIVVLCACSAQGRTLGFSNGVPGAVIKSSQCFGLARRTRTVTIDVPVLYNSQTGHTSPIPRFLLEVDDGTITKLEQDGWEVRQRRVCVPQHFYERVPVCCPWDQNCRQGDSQPASSAPGVAGPCANGGQLVYDNGLRRCECPSGFKGLWCQIPDLISKVRPTSSAPSGPLLRSRPVSPYQPMMTQADLWKRKLALQDQGRGDRPMMGGDMDVQQEQLMRAMQGPWARQVAMWHQQILMQAIAQWCRNNGLNRVPYELIRVVQASGGNPYSMQGRLPPQLLQLLSTVLQNPYSTASPNSHQMDVLVHRLVSQPGMAYDANRMYGQPHRGPGPMNPYSMVRPYGDRARESSGLAGPAPRTPWDLDPFQQSPQVTSSRPRGQSEQERQLMAMALYQQYLQTQQRGRYGVLRRPDVPRPFPPSSGMDLSSSYTPQTDRIPPPQARPPTPMMMPRGRHNQNPYSSMPGSQQPQMPDLLKNAKMPNVPDMPTDAQMPGDDQMPNDVPMLPMPNAAQMPGGPMPGAQMPGAQMPGAPMPGGPMQGGPMPGAQMPGAQMPGAQMPGAQMPGGPGGMARPSPEEIAKIEECRTELEPRMDVCLSVHGITMPQFMDPEYMAKAKPVCQSSASVGQCLMQLDKVCGNSEDQVALTRKMIDSVLQMMGMICQQIMARGDTAMPPAPEMPRPPAMAPTTTMDDSEPKPLPPVTREDPAEMEPRDELPAFVPPAEEKTDKFNKEPTTTKVNETPEKAASKSSDHGVAEPVQAGHRLWGYPLWMVIALLALIVALALLTVLLTCLCVRRKRRQQKTVELQKEIEKMPEPLDGAKLAAIGIPPPVYTTTVVNQTQEDGLTLPPLDIPEEEEDTKVEDEDADDESDEKEENGEKKEKKKEKKEKK